MLLSAATSCVEFTLQCRHHRSLGAQQRCGVDTAAAAQHQSVSSDSSRTQPLPQQKRRCRQHSTPVLLPPVRSSVVSPPAVQPSLCHNAVTMQPVHCGLQLQLILQPRRPQHWRNLRALLHLCSRHQQLQSFAATASQHFGISPALSWTSATMPQLPLTSSYNSSSTDVRVARLCYSCHGAAAPSPAECRSYVPPMRLWGCSSCNKNPVVVC